MPRRDPFDLAPARPKKKSVPFPFVLDELAPLDPFTRPMFGCLAVYVGEKIVLILRDKSPADDDNGVWVVSTPELQRALLDELPRLEPIAILGDQIGGWKKLASRSPEFEEDVLRACALILRGDERIGKVPGAKKPRAPKGAKPSARAGSSSSAKKAASPAKKAAKKPAPPGGKKPAKKAVQSMR